MKKQRIVFNSAIFAILILPFASFALDFETESFDSPSTSTGAATSDGISPADTEATGSCTECESTHGFLSRKARRNIKDISQTVPRGKPGDWSDFPEVERYSSSPQVATALAAAEANAKTRSAGLCLALVKYAACVPSERPGEQFEKYRNSRGGRRAQRPPPITDQDCEKGSLFGAGHPAPPVRHAKNMGTNLDDPPYSFVNMLKSSKYKSRIRGPGDAPMGAILVYKKRARRSCDNSSSGHIEFRGGGSHPEYMSDYYRDIPVSRSPRNLKSRCYELTGVYIRTDLGGQE